VVDVRDDLKHYFQSARDSVVASLDGLSEYDVRRPLVPSGTNLLGLVKHLVGVERGYLVESVGRSSAVVLPWYDDGSVWDNADMWAKPEESRDYIVGLYRAVWRESDASIGELPLDAPATVSWWAEERRQTTFGHLLVRTVAETAHHAGHADVVRELIDGHKATDPLSVDEQSAYWAAVQTAAEPFRHPRE
jgi:Protein of unknown function (DUF664)